MSTAGAAISSVLAHALLWLLANHIPEHVDRKIIFPTCFTSSCVCEVGKNDKRGHAEPENVCTKCFWLARGKRTWMELVKKSLIKLIWVWVVFWCWIFFFDEFVRSMKLNNNFAQSEFAFSGVPTQPCPPKKFQNKLRCQHIISMTFSFRLLLSWQTTWTQWILADSHIAAWPAEVTKSRAGATCRHELDARFCTNWVSVLISNLLFVLLFFCLMDLHTWKMALTWCRMWEVLKS